jgi:hypothetical protein
MVRSLKSPTFWVAFAALVIAMGGSAVAATYINGKSIRKGTIPGDRLGKNTLRGDRVKNGALTGADIAESKLGTVPRATVASAAGDTGFFGGMPPNKYVRFAGPANSPKIPQGNGISSGYVETGAYGCDTGRSCAISFVAPGNADLVKSNVRVGPGGGCSGTNKAPTAPAGVLCLYPLDSAPAAAGPLPGGSRYGFKVTAGATFVSGVYAYAAATP